MSKFDQRLEQVEHDRFPERRVEKTNKTNQLLESKLGDYLSISKDFASKADSGLRKAGKMASGFGSWAKNFRDQAENGSGLAALSNLSDGLRDTLTLKGSGDRQLDRSLKDQWDNMISAQRNQYNKPSLVMNTDPQTFNGLANANDDVAALRGLEGFDLFFTLGWLKQSSYQDWDKLTRGKWPRNMYGTQEKITPDDPRWDDHMTNKWSQKTQAYRDGYQGGFDAWKAQEELNFQQQ